MSNLERHTFIHLLIYVTSNDMPSTILGPTKSWNYNIVASKYGAQPLEQKGLFEHGSKNKNQSQN
jgi:hypothetical protein